MNVKPFPKDIDNFHRVISPDDKLFADVRAAGMLNTRGSTMDFKTLGTGLEADTLTHQALT